MESRSSRTAFAGISLVLALVSFALAERGSVQHQSFKAFYCAGVAVRARVDPYRVEPLRSCERTLETTPMPSGYVEPAPLPGYVLAFFALLSTLPPTAAAVILVLILAAAAILSAAALAPLVGAPRYAVLLALLPLTLLNVTYGEIAPLATLALCASAFFLATRRWRAAGIAVCLALVQPNLGLPAVLALLIFVPKSRAAVLVTGAALAVVSLATLGAAANLEYIFRVLPLMAAAEIGATDQYSLSHLLYLLGSSPNLAILAGKVWFCFAAAAGIVLAVRWSEGDRRELLALLPPAAVALLGIYLHDIQIIVALPAVLLLAVRTTGTARIVAAACLTLTIAVWTQPARAAVLLFDAAGAFGGVLTLMPGEGRRRILAASAVALATVAAVVLIQHASGPEAAQAVHSFGAMPGELSPLAWGRYIRANPSLTRPTIAPQLVTWLALSGIFACGFTKRRNAL